MNDADNPQEALARIKEILFGEELQDMDTRLAGLRSELMVVVENQVKTLEEKLSAQRKAFDKEIESLQAQIHHETEKSDGLNAGLRALRSQLDELINKSGQQQEENRKALQAMKKEWAETIRKLEKTKVNKTEIAELFGLMIQKLK